MHESPQRAQSMVTSPRLLFKFCLCVCPPHMTSAPLPGKWKGLLTEGPWNIITSLFIGTLKASNGKLFRKFCCYLWPCCAAPLLLLQSTSPGTLFRGEGHFVHAPALPSYLLEHIKPFRLASASTAVISSPITSFLPLLSIQQHHYWKLRLYSSSLKICLHYL